MRDALTEVLASWKEMERALDERLVMRALGQSSARVLQLMLDTCNRFAPQEARVPRRKRLPPSQPMAGATRRTMTPGAWPGASRRCVSGEVAEWFKRNEPNSPIGFTLDEAVRRARLSWPDLIAELVSDETARQALLTSAGMKRPVVEP